MLSITANRNLEQHGNRTAPSGVTIPPPANSSRATATPSRQPPAPWVSGPTRLSSGPYPVGADLTYTIGVDNTAPGAQADNPGNEFATSCLPPALVAATPPAVAAAGTRSPSPAPARGRLGFPSPSRHESCPPPPGIDGLQRRGQSPTTPTATPNDATAQTDDPQATTRRGPTPPASQVPSAPAPISPPSRHRACLLTIVLAALALAIRIGRTQPDVLLHYRHPGREKLSAARPCQSWYCRPE